MQSLNQAHLICMELVHLIRWTTAYQGEKRPLQRVPGEERERPGIADRQGQYRADFKT